MASPAQDWNDPATVAEWVAGHGQQNLGRADQLAMVLTLLAAHQPAGARILDLGCGDGLVAALVLDRLPGSTVTGLDQSAPMLDAAAARLAPYGDRATLLHRPFGDESPLPGAVPFDAAIAVQSVHHLDGPGKQRLFAWVAGQLRPGGLFLLSDRVALPSAGLFPYYQALFAARQAQTDAPGLPEGFGYAAHLRALAQRGDRPDTVEDQLDWLRAAGFGDAACFYRFVERAIFGGLNGHAGPRNAPLASDDSAAIVDRPEAADHGF